MPAVSLAPAALRQLATLLFSVANKPLAVCAWLVHGAAVPLNLYRPKSDKRNLDRRIVYCFMAALLFSRFSAAKRKEDGREGLDVRIQIGDELLTLASDCEGGDCLVASRVGLRLESRFSFFEIVIAFSGDSLLKRMRMAQRDSALFTVTPRSVSVLALMFLLLAAFFGLLNGQKAKALRTTTATSRPLASALPSPGSGAQQQGKAANTEERAAKAEAALAQAGKVKADLQGKLDASQQEIAALRQRAAETNESAAGTPPASAENAQRADLQSQVDDLRRQLEGAEKEKALLAEKLQDAPERAAQPKEAAKAESKKRRDRETATPQRETVSSHRAGVHGTVLAYNQAYNFVVLNLGARNGVEPKSEMLVLRDGTLIGKIRISSVEPATAIGDIITNSLARGVEVQPGDSVIYAGTSP